MTNVTGYNDLVAGNMGTATFSMLDYVFGGWFALITIIVIQILVVIRTKNYPITVSVGLLIYAIFAGVQVTAGQNILETTQDQVLLLVMAFEFAGAIYYLAAK